MQAARPARSRAGRQGPAYQRVGAGGERAGFLVAHVHPLDAAAMDRIGDVVEGIADDAVAMAHAGSLQGFHDDFGNALGHGDSIGIGERRG